MPRLRPQLSEREHRVSLNGGRLGPEALHWTGKVFVASDEGAGMALPFQLPEDQSRLIAGCGAAPHGSICR